MEGSASGKVGGRVGWGKDREGLRGGGGGGGGRGDLDSTISEFFRISRDWVTYQLQVLGEMKEDVFLKISEMFTPSFSMDENLLDWKYCI